MIFDHLVVQPYQVTIILNVEKYFLWGCGQVSQYMNETHVVNRASERIAYVHVANDNYIINHVVI